ncbi:VWA domain-containing protein [Alteromonas confluentis]|uniref:VWFA domain-containing protein n=1 Tax=Alteromonas confluentis TaxID=1656094 RepID=A0A1E7Z8U8_9ALTE|nr:VWA domain-containing protein [Alteromonas confluentis]OFC69907.1 hypothetical protein BFC18_00435 [Alteromonas confluentis]
MSISFLHPAYLALLTLLPVIWYFRRGKDRVLPVLRCLLVLCITLALMEPVIQSHSNAIHHVVIVDRSPSVSETNAREAVEQANQFLSHVEADDADVIVLGNSDASEFNNVPTAVIPTTSLTQAVMTALASVPYGKSGVITLFSDGYATDDHWEPVLAALEARNVTLNWIETDSAPAQPTIQTTPYPAFYPGQSPTLTINVLAESRDASTLSLRLTSQTGETIEASLGEATEDNLYSPVFELPASEEVFSTWQADLIDNNQIVDIRTIVLAAQSPIPVLMGTSNESDGEHLQSLLGKAFNVSAAPFPWTEPMDFSQYEAVVLNDASESALPVQLQNALIDAINSGTGLLYTGSEQAFSTNGLARSPLADLLPVNIDNTETKREPGISLAIIIDSSGSMQGQPIELAKQVARLAVRKLKPQDQVGIVEFYGTRQWAVPMQPVQDTETLERAIGRLQAQGGSELFPAIEEAYFGLKSSHNKYRHILLITDAAVEEQNYQKLLQYIASDQINISTVLVGDNATGEERMADLANWGRGRFYAVYNEFSMVELNFRRADKIPASAYKEGDFTVRDAASAAPFPSPVRDYTTAPLKPTAITEWTIDNSQDPLLASWQAGVGKVTALMTEPFGKGTESWAGMPEYGQKLGGIIGSLAALANRATLTTQRSFGQINVQFSAQADNIQPELQWKRSDETSWHDAPIRLRAPGLFTGKINVARDATVEVKVSTTLRTYYSALSPLSDLRPEFQFETQYAQRLQQVVTGSGGTRSLAETRQDASITGNAFIKTFALMPFALAMALVLYLSEIIYRRWPSRRNSRFPGNVV